MALSTKRLYYYKNATQAINLYTSLSDIPSGQALQVRDSSGTLYAALGSTGDSNATNLRVQKGGTTYAVLSTTTILILSPTSLNLAPEASTGSIAVTSNTSWSAVSNQSWLTITPGSGTISYTAQANTNTVNGRDATITVSGGNVVKICNVYQNRAYNIYGVWTSPGTYPITPTQTINALVTQCGKGGNGAPGYWSGNVSYQNWGGGGGGAGGAVFRQAITLQAGTTYNLIIYPNGDVNFNSAIVTYAGFDAWEWEQGEGAAPQYYRGGRGGWYIQGIGSTPAEFGTGPSGESVPCGTGTMAGGVAGAAPFQAFWGALEATAQACLLRVQDKVAQMATTAAVAVAVAAARLMEPVVLAAVHTLR